MKTGLVMVDCCFLGRPLPGDRRVCHLLQIGSTDIQQCLGCHHRTPRKGFIVNERPQHMTTEQLVAQYLQVTSEQRASEQRRISLDRESPERHALWFAKKDRDKTLQALMMQMRQRGVPVPTTPEAPVPVAMPAATSSVQAHSAPSGAGAGRRTLSKVFTTRDGEPAPLCGLFRGSSLFLILSGPSINEMMPLDRLRALLSRRGAFTMGVNNSPAIVRTNLWTYGDKSTSFHHGIWRDPGIMKFMPKRCFGNFMRAKENGKFFLTRELCREQPNTWGYERNACFSPERFLDEDSINWGNSSKTGDPKYPHVINIMFAALKIPYLLGFRKVFLLGCDFHMPPKGPVYAFAQGKNSQGAIDSNNAAFLKCNHMLNLLQPKFLAAGYEVYNCTPRSGLHAFPKMDFERAIDVATSHVPAELDTTDWYTSDEGRPVRQPRRGRKRG